MFLNYSKAHTKKRERVNVNFAAQQKLVSTWMWFKD